MSMKHLYCSLWSFSTVILRSCFRRSSSLSSLYICSFSLRNFARSSLSFSISRRRLTSCRSIERRRFGIRGRCKQRRSLLLLRLLLAGTTTDEAQCQCNINIIETFIIIMSGNMAVLWYGCSGKQWLLFLKRVILLKVYNQMLTLYNALSHHHQCYYTSEQVNKMADRYQSLLHFV